MQSAQALAKTVEASGDTKSERMQLLGAATAALQAKELADQAAKLGEALAKGTDIAQAADISVSVSLGSSKSQSNSSQSSDSARGSSVTAGGDVNITAKGAGTDSDITVQGSTVKAGDTTRLNAEDEVKLLAARNTQTETNSQSSKSGSVGVTFATTGISATASASRGQGQGAGDGTTYTNAQVSGQSVQIEAGADTTLKGAVVQGDQVALNVGGNLNIESLQDSNRYNESSKNAGFSVSVPITGANASASVNAGKTNIDSNYQSVNEQSAIRTGDGGFQVNVAGNTTLTGGQITSSEQAVQAGKNTFSTGGSLSTSDLNNSASFDASGVNIGVGVSRSQAKDGAGKPQSNDDGSPKINTTPNHGVSFGNSDGAASSTTVAAISGLAGNTAARTGDVETGIQPIFNKDEAKQEVNAQIAITQEAGKRIPKAIGDQMGRKRDELKAQAEDADRAGDTEKAKTLRTEAQRYDEGGAYRNAAHTALGALVGGADGALGAAASSAAAPALDTIQRQLQTALQDAGMSAEASQQVASLSAGALAATLGATAGGTAGAGAAFNADMNNRQLHPTEKQRIKDLAKGDAQKEARLTAAACALVKCYAEYPEGSVAYNTLKAMADAGGSDAMAAERQQLQAQQGLFNYSRANEALDSAKQINNTYQVTTRVVGAGQALLGGAGVVTSVLTAPASCPTGIGCVANAAVATISADAAVTGVKQAISGQPENTYLNQALQGLGLSPEAASYAEFALGVGAAAKVGSVVNAATATQAANNAAARMSYEDIAKFGAKGLNATPEVMQTPQARALMAEYQAAGLTADDAIRYSTGVLQTGNALPVVRTVAGNEELIKVVPKNVAGSDGVGAFSPYFMTRSEYDALSKLSPAEIGQRLGLPAEQSVRGAQLGFEAFAITPKPGTAPKVFTSTVAPVEQGAYKAVGGAQQTIVPNRSLWTEPKPIGTIGGNK